MKYCWQVHIILPRLQFFKAQQFEGQHAWSAESTGFMNDKDLQLHSFVQGVLAVDIMQSEYHG